MTAGYKALKPVFGMVSNGAAMTGDGSTLKNTYVGIYDTFIDFSDAPIVDSGATFGAQALSVTVAIAAAEDDRLEVGGSELAGARRDVAGANDERYVAGVFDDTGDTRQQPRVGAAKHGGVGAVDGHSAAGRVGMFGDRRRRGDASGGVVDHATEQTPAADRVGLGAHAGHPVVPDGPVERSVAAQLGKHGADDDAALAGVRSSHDGVAVLRGGGDRRAGAVVAAWRVDGGDGAGTE